MNKLLSFSIAFFLFTISSLALPKVSLADSSIPSHACTQPVVPDQIQTKEELEAFQTQMDAYETCIQEFIGEQNQAIKNHEKAGLQAQEDWTNFLKEVNESRK